ncbi:hypothetical protein RHMOL_Rhmol04G0234900 [Rhododendron molle]|uniref:Uncharacterized protein n=1 Tax=Rhododendron molle TaxID=49168 RepID=A0ACC0P3E0_RHOML|nr:hypothetical protein RHMOL_Rhmol04G0234900 [Rhododendron molle]
MLFHQIESINPEEEVEEYVWDPQPDAGHVALGLDFSFGQVDTDSDIDEQYLSYYAEGELIPDERRPFGAMLPLISSISNAVDDHICEFDPTLNIVSAEQPRSASPPVNLWDVNTVVDVVVGDEVWTVNIALVDGGLVMEDLAQDLALRQDTAAMVASVDKGKRKLGDVPTDL